MHSSTRLLLFLGLAASPLLASEPDVDGALKADDARIAAITSGDVAKMTAVFSADLVYVHSSGLVNHKADYIDLIASHRLQYLGVVYEVREFRSVAPGIVLMNGRCHINSSSKGHTANNYYSVLAVYRLEADVWRFVGWQSCKLTADSPPYVAN